MALTNAQLADAINDADLQKRFRGQILKLAGYIANGDSQELPSDLRIKRSLWASRVLFGADGDQYLVDTAARLLRYSAGTHGRFMQITNLADITDTDIEFMLGAVWDTSNPVQDAI